MEPKNPVNYTVPKWGSPEWKKYYANLQGSRPTTPRDNMQQGPVLASYTLGGKPVGFGKLARKSRKSRKGKSRKGKSCKGRKSRKSRTSRK